MNSYNRTLASAFITAYSFFRRCSIITPLATSFGKGSLPPGSPGAQLLFWYRVSRYIENAIFCVARATQILFGNHNTNAFNLAHYESTYIIGSEEGNVRVRFSLKGYHKYFQHVKTIMRNVIPIF